MITSEVACPECGTLWLRSTSSDGAHQPKPYCSEKCEDKAENPTAGTCPKCGRTICVGCDHFTPAQIADKGAEKTCQCSYGDRLWNSFNQCLNCMRSIYVPSMTTPAQTADPGETRRYGPGVERVATLERYEPPTPPEPDGLIEWTEQWLYENGHMNIGTANFNRRFATVVAQAIAADRLKRAEAPADLIAAAKAYCSERNVFPAAGDDATLWPLMTGFAAKQRIEAVDEFVEMLEKRMKTYPFGMSILELRSVAEEMKR